MEKNSNIYNVFSKILENDELSSKFQNCKNLEKAYKFLKSLDSRITEKEFLKFINELMQLILEQNKLEDDVLSEVTGGAMNKGINKSLAALLGTLSIFANVGATSNVTENETLPQSNYQQKSDLKETGKTVAKWAASIGLSVGGLLTAGYLIRQNMNLSQKYSEIFGKKITRNTIVGMAAEPTETMGIGTIFAIPPTNSLEEATFRVQSMWDYINPNEQDRTPNSFIPLYADGHLDPSILVVSTRGDEKDNPKNGELLGTRNFKWSSSSSKRDITGQIKMFKCKEPLKFYKFPLGICINNLIKISDGAKRSSSSVSLPKHSFLDNFNLDQIYGNIKSKDEIAMIYYNAS